MSSSEDESSDEESCQCPHPFHTMPTNTVICGPAIEGSKGCKYCVQTKEHGKAYHNRWKMHGSVSDDKWAEGYEKYEEWEKSKTGIDRSAMSGGPFRYWLRFEGGREAMGLDLKPRGKRRKRKNKNNGKPHGSQSTTRPSEQDGTSLSWSTVDPVLLSQNDSGPATNEEKLQFLPVRSLSSADCGISSEYKGYFPDIPLPSNVHLRYKVNEDSTASLHGASDFVTHAQADERTWYPVDSSPRMDEGFEDFDEEDELWVVKAMGNDQR